MKMKMKKKKLITNDYYFCLCDYCGSKEWLDDENKANCLEDDGSQLIPLKIKHYLTSGCKNDYPICYYCEKKLNVISFATIPKKERKQVAKMTAEDRKLWIQNLIAVKELEKGGW